MRNWHSYIHVHSRYYIHRVPGDITRITVITLTSQLSNFLSETISVCAELYNIIWNPHLLWLIYLSHYSLFFFIMRTYVPCLCVCASSIEGILYVFDILNNKKLNQFLLSFIQSYRVCHNKRMDLDWG